MVTEPWISIFKGVLRIRMCCASIPRNSKSASHDGIILNVTVASVGISDAVIPPSRYSFT